jgi:hypothetical protein
MNGCIVALAALVALILLGTAAGALGLSAQHHARHHVRNLKRHAKHHRARRHVGKHPHRGKPVVVGRITGHDPVLLGDTNIEAMSDNNPAGQPEAWPYVALVTGKATSISFCVDGGVSASTGVLGLYSVRISQHGSLLASATFQAIPSSWNNVPISGVQVTAGTRY